ncbi:MAG: chemotaxis protein CheY [Sulfuricurvum sp. PC08-66]|nr:MAG: chemotaxis protein CheY [Sulfuricurvum sp. PC08-66]
MTKTIEVFIVDDSAIARTTIAGLIENEADIVVIGTAADPILAQQKFARIGMPDVIILDIEMPRMDGLTFLRHIMRESPTPVIICSSVAQAGSRNAMEALSLGAVEIITKPEVGLRSFLEESRYWLIHAIRAAYASKTSLRAKRPASAPMTPLELPPSTTQKLTADAVVALKPALGHTSTHTIFAIGSSTGGVQTLERILPQLGAKTPPILITQHMPPGFTRSLSERLDRVCAMSVKEAADGDKLLHGRVLIAPGDKHMTLKRSGNSYHVEIKDGPKVSRHKPSVDVLFRSCANEAGANAVGFLLTGMGDDGARGLKEMRNQGALTYAQEEASCIVYGMPKAAIESGAAIAALSLDAIVEILQKG